MLRQLRQLRQLFKLPPRQSSKHQSSKHQRFKHQSFKHQPPHRLSKRQLFRRRLRHLLHQSLKRQLLKLLLPPRHQLLHRGQLSPVELLSANQLVMRPVKHLVLLLHDQIRRVRRPLVVHLVSPRLVDPPPRRRVVQSAQLVAQFRRRRVAQ